MSGTRRVVVKKPEDIAPVDTTPLPIPNAEQIEIGGNVYEEAGVCPECGQKVYKFVSGDVQTNTIGNRQVVYVAYSSRERPGTYCQAHDPNLAHRMASQQSTGVIAGDTWRPRA